MCKHNDYLEPEWCTVCIHGPEITRAKKPAKAPKPKLKLDRFEALVERYVSGSWCPKCNTPFHKGLCQCQRESRFTLHEDVISEWTAQQPTERQAKQAKFIAIGAVSREITRAGFGDRPESDLLPGVTRRQAEMAMIRAKVDLPLRWAASRVTVADPDPMPG